METSEHCFERSKYYYPIFRVENTIIIVIRMIRQAFSGVPRQFSVDFDWRLTGDLSPK